MIAEIQVVTHGCFHTCQFLVQKWIAWHFSARLISGKVRSTNRTISDRIFDLAFSSSLPKVEYEHVKICIQDNGHGIPEHIIDKLFNPFFTTKDVGKGTGLGLSISYTIVTEKHQGTLHCSSQLGQGTEFTIQIPIHQSNAHAF